MRQPEDEHEQPCWTDCLYKAALGPEAGTPGGALAGMSTDDLVAAWEKPFLPEAQGGCPPQQELPPWFAGREAEVFGAAAAGRMVESAA